MKKKLIVNKSNIRFDRYLSNNLKDISRELLSQNIKKGNILLNNKKQKPSYLLEKDDLILIIDLVEFKKEINLDKDINLNIIFEDDYLLVLNKNSGDIVHKGNGVREKTIVDKLLEKNIKLSNLEKDKNRLGVLHRLDKNTSGLLIFLKDKKAHSILKEDLKKRKIKRIYYALVNGVIKEDKAKIKIPINRDKLNRTKMSPSSDGKKAVTNFKVLKRYKNNTLLECKLQTGRTHQIRVHLAYINHFIVNDEVYGQKDNRVKSTAFLLHSKKIEFTHPITKENMKFECELPNYFKKFQKNIN